VAHFLRTRPDAALFNGKLGRHLNAPWAAGSSPKQAFRIPVTCVYPGRDRVSRAAAQAPAQETAGEPLRVRAGAPRAFIAEPVDTRRPTIAPPNISGESIRRRMLLRRGREADNRHTAQIRLGPTMPLELQLLRNL